CRAPRMTLTLDMLPQLAAIVILIFARIGTMVMLMPALGEASVPARFRLSIAVMLSLMFLPLLTASFTVALAIPALIGALLQELAVGLVIGGTGRMLLGGL